MSWQYCCFNRFRCCNLYLVSRWINRFGYWRSASFNNNLYGNRYNFIGLSCKWYFEFGCESYPNSNSKFKSNSYLLRLARDLNWIWRLNLHLESRQFNRNFCNCKPNSKYYLYGNRKKCRRLS